MIPEALTLLSVIRDGLQVDEVGAYHGRFDGIVVSELDLDALAQGREHFREDQLFVPDGGVAVLFYAGFTLATTNN